MKINTYEEIFGKPLTVGELINGFSEDTQTGSVVALSGNLNIRPPYQREFIYEKNKQVAVINTILSGYPLNAIYWAKLPDGTFELMDGQQRIMSICAFYDNRFSLKILDGNKENYLTFESLNDDLIKKSSFLNYPLMVYICEGESKEKLNWFETINIASIKLTDQELRNATYNGTWVTDAKRYFSQVNCKAVTDDGREILFKNNKQPIIYGDYLNVKNSNCESEKSITRQFLLQTVLEWATNKYNIEHNFENKEQISIREFMDKNKNNKNAHELIRYYEDVMEWVKETFPTYYNCMKGVDWGILYNKYGSKDTEGLNEKVAILMGLEVDKESKIFEAVLSGNWRELNKRAFKDEEKKSKYNEQKGICPYCKKHFEYNEMQGDHIRPWTAGGKTDKDNLQMLCSECNLFKHAININFEPWNTTVYEDYEKSELEKQGIFN